MLALIPQSGDFSGASLEMPSEAFLHVFFMSTDFRMQKTNIIFHQYLHMSEKSTTFALGKATEWSVS